MNAEEHTEGVIATGGDEILTVVTERQARDGLKRLLIEAMGELGMPPAAIEEVIRTYHVGLGFPGVKTYTPSQCIDYDDPLLARWLEYANGHHLYMVFDPKGGIASTEVLANVASRYQQLRIHLDHCGQSWDYAKWAVEMARRFPNIYAQLNYTMVTNGVIEYLVEKVSAERLLFGTDAPMRDPRPQVGWLVFSRLHEKQKRLIFGENFLRQLRGCYPNGRDAR